MSDKIKIYTNDQGNKGRKPYQGKNQIYYVYYDHLLSPNRSMTPIYSGTLDMCNSFIAERKKLSRHDPNYDIYSVDFRSRRK